MTYHIAIKGVKKDPVSEETLRAMISEGTLGADTLCWREGWTNWQPVTTAFPELFLGHVALAPHAMPTPLTTTTVPTSASGLETLRKDYLGHEASVRSVGVLYLIAALLMLLIGTAELFGFSPDGPKKTTAVPPWIMGGLFIALSLVYFQIGRWLRALNPKARTPATVLAVLGLLGFPVGTLINLYILYLLRSDKGTMVFSEHYQEVMTATPHIRYKTPRVIWILLGLVVAFLTLGIVAALLGSHHKS